MMRYGLMLLLFVLAVGIPARFPGPDPTSAAGSLMAQAAPAVPEEVLAAAADGRYWRASRLMDDYLATVADTTPETILLAARLHAGWDDWGPVGELLEGREWLDSVERGAGWELVGRSRVAGGEPGAGAEALGRYLELHPVTDRERGITEVRRGQALARAEETEAALDALDRAARLLPWFADRAALFAAEAAAATGDTAAVADRLAAAGPIAAGASWRLRLRAAREAGDSMAAREIALETARTASGASTRAEAWAELGSLRLAAGERERARAAFLEAMEAPGTSAAVDAARALSDLDPGPEGWRRIADIYARHGNPQRAVHGYTEWLEAGIGTAAERAQVRLRRGRALYNAGQYARAERELLELAGSDVGETVGAEALYLAGRAQYRQGRSEEGQQTLAQLPERFSGPEAVAEGLYLLADLKHDDLELDGARRYYRLAAQASPSINEAGLALMRLGGLEMLEEDYAAAAEIYEDYRRMHPDGRRWGQATYWAARAYEAMGRTADARALLRAIREKDPISYYGARAADLLEEPLLDIPMTAGPPADSAAEARIAEGLRRIDVLAELDHRSELVDEVERLREAIEGQTAAEYALAEALNERGYTLTAIGMGWDLFRRTGEWNQRLLRIIYPFPFRSLVLPEAAERSLDPFLVAGLIRRESAFNPTVTSSAGAVGLMQIMPETGATLARAVGLEDFETELLKQPEVNLSLGTRYLDTMLDRFDQDLPLVLSAYNAGPTRAVRWQELPEVRDPELFTERIPYAETRDYVRNVLLHRALYRALYPDLEVEPES